MVLLFAVWCSRAAITLLASTFVFYYRTQYCWVFLGRSIDAIDRMQTLKCEISCRYIVFSFGRMKIKTNTKQEQKNRDKNQEFCDFMFCVKLRCIAISNHNQHLRTESLTTWNNILIHRNFSFDCSNTHHNFEFGIRFPFHIHSDRLTFDNGDLQSKWKLLIKSAELANDLYKSR